MSLVNPTVDDFKVYFARDFPFGNDPETSVLDSDIAKAYMVTNITIRKSLFCDQSAYTIAYLLLAAHQLCLNMQASSDGLDGSFGFLESSKSVGSVSQGFTIPQRFLDNPLFMMYTKTSYGMQYLMMIYPLLTGVVTSVAGRTHA